jgi:hypothetical protein
MNLWPNHTSFSSEEIVSFCKMFLSVFPQESFSDEHAYFQQLIDDNS